MSRPRPVVLAGAAATLLAGLAGTAAFLDLLPDTVKPYVLGLAAAGPLVAAFVAQMYVTPLSAPQDAAGVQLVPVTEPAQPPAPTLPEPGISEGGVW